MIQSLRTRVVALCAIVALLTAALGLWFSSHILMSVIDTHHQEHVDQAVEFRAREEQRLIARMIYEVGDYARWDDLYDRMPDPGPEWARNNLSPGSFHGALNRGMALISEDHVTGRYLTGGRTVAASQSQDPATGPELVQAAHDRPGLFIAGGRILLAVSDHIVHTDLRGPAKGLLLGYRYFDDELREQLTPIGWELRYLVAPAGTPLQNQTISLENDFLVVNEVRAVPGGALVITMRLIEDLAGNMRHMVIRGALIAGAMGVMLSSLLGALLGWHWMEPIRQLAAACRRRSAGQALEIPDCRGLRETADLAADLRDLIEAENQARLAQQLALEQLQIAHALQSRFCERLAEELAEPLRILGGLIGRLQLAQPVDAGAVIEAQDAMTQIEGRLSDSITFSQLSGARASTDVAVHLPTWTESVMRSLEPRAFSRGVHLTAQVDESRVRLNVKLLTPLLIHLLSNALNAAPSGSDIILCVQVSEQQMSFTVIDQGPGMSPEFLILLRSVCARSEVMPGEPGIGFGLSLVIERSAQLGGHLEVLRSDNRGTHIRLTLQITPHQVH